MLNKKKQRRTIIIHSHLFKNAGSTIDWALYNNFQNGFIDHRDDNNMKKGAKYLGGYLRENPKIKALSTHHLRPPLPTIENCVLLTLMMFRHPIERVTSVYNFERKQTDANTLGAKYARKHSLREYVLWRIQLNVPPTIRNFHIYRSLPAPVNWKKEAGETELSTARRYVESVEMIGMVELFDESMILFEEKLKPYYPSIDLSYKSQNIGQSREETIESRINWLKQEIGEDAYSLLIDANKKDLDLYYYARKLFLSRIDSISKLNEKILNLRDRCIKQHN